MKAGYRRFAPIGLYLAGLAALVTLGLYVVQREWNPPIQISLSVIVLGLVLFVFLDPDRARRLVTRRQARYGSNAIVLILALFGILIVVNYLVFQNAQDWNLRWDLTEDQEHTLAQETLDTLATLPEPVVARAFYTTRLAPTAVRARDLLNDYKFFANGNFDYVFIDPEENPILAQQANITRDGTIILEMGELHEPVSFVTEREITASLVRLLNPEEQKIYFLTGHGERTIENSDDESLGQVKSALENKNYTVETLNLLVTNEIPEDATTIVVVDPSQPVSSDEVTLLKDYLDGGGAMIVMQEPTPLTEFDDTPDPLADYLVGSWGIAFGDDIVVDLASNQPLIAVAFQYADHDITRKLQGLATFFPNTRTVQVTEPVDGINQIELVLTSEQSWGETDFESISTGQNVTADEGVDIIGPVSLAVVAEDNTTNARLVVFGDADFASNGFYNVFGNGDLFINSLDWVAEQENIINLTPKNQTQRFLVPPQRYTLGLILLGTVFVIPGLVLLSGIVVWIRRRRRV